MSITQEQFEQEKARLERAKERRLERIAKLLAEFEAEQDSAKCGALGRAINDLHDAEWAIQDALRALESRWTTRNWTQADWDEYELVLDNID